MFPGKTLNSNLSRNKTETRLIAAILSLLVVSVFATVSWPDDEVLDVALQEDGKSILVGKFSPDYIMRRNADGTEDPSFNAQWSAGGFNKPVHAVVLQPDDKILLGGEFTSFDQSLLGYICRLNTDGSLDLPFASNIGTGFDDTVTALVVDDQGYIYVGGHFSSFNGTNVSKVARLNHDGSLDESFKSDLDNSGAIFTLGLLPMDQGVIAGGDFSIQQVVTFFTGLDLDGKLKAELGQ